MRKEKLQKAEIRWLNQIMQSEALVANEKAELFADIAKRLDIEVDAIKGLNGDELLIAMDETAKKVIEDFVEESE